MHSVRVIYADPVTTLCVPPCYSHTTVSNIPFDRRHSRPSSLILRRKTSVPDHRQIDHREQPFFSFGLSATVIAVWYEVHLDIRTRQEMSTRPGHWDVRHVSIDSYMDIVALHIRSEIRRLLFLISRVTASRCSNLEPKLIWLNCLISPYTTTHLGPYSYKEFDVISPCSREFGERLDVLTKSAVSRPYIVRLSAA